jgi:hypothetical protein
MSTLEANIESKRDQIIEVLRTINKNHVDNGLDSAMMERLSDMVHNLMYASYKNINDTNLSKFFFHYRIKYQTKSVEELYNLCTELLKLRQELNSQNNEGIECEDEAEKRRHEEKHTNDLRDSAKLVRELQIMSYPIPHTISVHRHSSFEWLTGKYWNSSFYNVHYGKVSICVNPKTDRVLDDKIRHVLRDQIVFEMNKLKRLHDKHKDDSVFVKFGPINGRFSVEDSPINNYEMKIMVALKIVDEVIRTYYG